MHAADFNKPIEIGKRAGHAQHAMITAIIETSSNSAGSSGGRIEGKRAASMDLPEPGGPTIRIIGIIKFIML